MIKKTTQAIDLTTSDILVSVFDNEFEILDVAKFPNFVSVVVHEIGTESTYSWRFQWSELVYVKVN